MKVKQGGKWVSIGGTGDEVLLQGNPNTLPEGFNIGIQGSLVLMVPTGVTSLSRVLDGWDIKGVPKIQNIGQVTDMSYMFENATISGDVDFSELPMDNVDNVNNMFNKVTAPEGLDLSGLNWSNTGYNNMLYTELNAPSVRFPVVAGGMSIFPAFLTGISWAGSVPVIEVNGTRDLSMFNQYKTMLGLTDADVIIRRYV